MANWSNLKSSINSVIKTNANQEITGQVLQNVLNTIVSTVGENATFVGVATPTTNPGTPDGNVFYIAKNPGVYPNFSSIEVYVYEIGILYWNTSSWEKHSISLSKLIEEVNISNIYPTDGTDGSNKYTLETAIAKVPAELRNVGIKCSFINDLGILETWEYRGGAAYQSTASWAQVGVEKILELSQGFMQDSYMQDHKKSTISGWNSVSVENNVQTSVFGGEVRNADKVTIMTHSGNTWAFNIESQVGNTGKVINVNAMIYSPVAFSVIWYVYSGSGGTYEWVSPNTYSFKKGINYIWLAVKVTTESSGGIWQIYFTNSQIVGQVFYSVQYFYYGTRRMIFFPNATAYTDDKVNDKPCLIQGIYPSAYKKYNVENWDASKIERDYETNVFGKTMLVTKVTMPGNTGNQNDFQIRFMYQGNQIDGLEEGDRINVNFLLWVPTECELSVSVIDNGLNGDIEVITGKYLRKGINSVILSAITTGDIERNAMAVCNLTLGENEVFYLTQPITYIGYPVANTILFDEMFVAKEEGKGLSDENFTAEDKEKLASVDTVNIYDNICKSEGRIGHDVVSLNSDLGGNLVAEKNENEGRTGWAFINWRIDDGIYWKQNHVYYFAISCLVESNSLTEGDDSTGGNNSFSLSAKYDLPTVVGNGSCKEGVVTGTKGVMKFIIRTDNTIAQYPKSNQIFVQLGYYSIDDYVKVTIYDIILIDLGENADDASWNIMDEQVQANMQEDKFLDVYSIIENCRNSINSQYAKTAEVANRLAAGRDIECWGDSLTAQNYAQDLAQILGRNCYNHGYGGKTSTYIRDQFLSNFNPNRTQVIWVGRNNYHMVNAVVDDIRDMVAAFGKQNFIIMMPPNGNFGDFGTDENSLYPEDGTGEMRGSGTYNKFIKLADMLSKEYPANFLDNREASINGWCMGNVKLLLPFVQPEVGGSVQIHVSDANFLTTYNENDKEKFGEDFMQHIRIGIEDSYPYNQYKVISKDSDTLLTVQLVQASGNNPVGATIANLVDNGGTDSVIYLRVMQEADYMCWRYDTTLSTFRSDGIHMTEDGKKLIAEIVARKITAMGI